MVFEIWLGARCSHFSHGVAHLNDGTTVPLAERVHTSTYGRDTLLLDREDRYKEMNSPQLWYIEENGLSFYTWDEDIKTIVFRNDPDKDLEISRFGILGVGETRELRREAFYGQR